MLLLTGVWRAIAKKYKVGEEVRRSQFAGGYKVGRVVAVNKDDSYDLNYGEGVKQEDRLEERVIVEDLRPMKVKKAGKITIVSVDSPARVSVDSPARVSVGRQDYYFADRQGRHPQVQVGRDVGARW
jgi:hypothetical protein